jgi:hypothetical protein
MPPTSHLQPRARMAHGPLPQCRGGRGELEGTEVLAPDNKRNTP